MPWQKRNGPKEREERARERERERTATREFQTCSRDRVGTYRLVYHLNLPRALRLLPLELSECKPTPRLCRLPSTQGDYEVLIACRDRVTRAIRSDLPGLCSSLVQTAPAGSNGIVILTLRRRWVFPSYARQIPCACWMSGNHVLPDYVIFGDV